MNYEEAVKYLYGLGKFGSRPGLERISHLLRQLGDPHRDLPVIHVAGTNGKGSTCSYIASVLDESGLQVGVYSSPHLQTVRERITIGKKLMPRDALARLITEIKKIVDAQVNRGGEHATFFEIITAVMYRYFRDADVDVAVLEVGMGGRYDATNVVGQPLCSVITNIALEHTEVLGSTRAEIAREKAGIIKDGALVVTGCRGDALRVIEEVSADHHAQLEVLRERSTSFDSASTYVVESVDEWGGTFSFRGNKWRMDDLRISMLGEHQIRNAALAALALEQVNLEGHGEIAEGALRRGLQRSRWPGRMERVQDEPIVLLDGAHNPHGTQVLKESMASLFSGRPIHAVVGILNDKDERAMLKNLSAVINGTLVTTSPPTPRGMEAGSLARAAESIFPDAVEIFSADAPADALEICLGRAEDRDVVLVLGSLYLVGALRGRWRDPVEHDDEEPHRLQRTGEIFAREGTLYRPAKVEDNPL